MSKAVLSNPGTGGVARCPLRSQRDRSAALTGMLRVVIIIVERSPQQDLARLMIDNPDPVLLASNRNDGEIPLDDFSDEQLEAAGSGTNAGMIWTFSVLLIYCRFC